MLKFNLITLHLWGPYTYKVPTGSGAHWWLSDDGYIKVKKTPFVYVFCMSDHVVCQLLSHKSVTVQDIVMMVPYGKKTWWLLPSQVLDTTEWTVETGYDNEHVNVTPFTHSHLSWVCVEVYPDDVLIESPFWWYLVLSEPDGMHTIACRFHGCSASC